MNNKLIKKNLDNKPYLWWIRSAYSNSSDYAGFIRGDGYVNYFLDVGFYLGCSPAYLII